MLNNEWEIFHGKNKLYFDEIMITIVALYQTNIQSEYYTASSLKHQKSADTHVFPLRHIIPDSESTSLYSSYTLMLCT